MKHVAPFALAAILTAVSPGYFALCYGADLRDPVPADVKSLVQSNSVFAVELFGKLSPSQSNLIFSPYSISGCLGMLYAGAQGQTAAQMSQTLHFNADPKTAASSFARVQELSVAVKQNTNASLNIANGLWAQKAHPILASFEESARNNFQASLRTVDFQTQAEPARLEINSWVADKTKGKIVNLFAPGTIDSSACLVLVNAIYFKDRWNQPFRKNNTSDQPFHVALDRQVQVPLMNLKGSFSYAELENLQLIVLPYANRHLSMIILLPKQIGDLSKLEPSVNADTLASYASQARLTQVDLYLPRFKIAAQFSLRQTLSEMGMKDAFTTKADFSGIDGARDLLLTAVVHKAFIDVNEEGTEAAAATGAVASLRAVRPQPAQTFRADHPFLFIIQDSFSGSILFMGRLVDPSHEGAGRKYSFRQPEGGNR